VKEEAFFSARRDAELETRLDVAMRIIESSVIGAELFLHTQPIFRIPASGSVASILAIDIPWHCRLAASG
jgi:hypothetical protein